MYKSVQLPEPVPEHLPRRKERKAARVLVGILLVSLAWLNWQWKEADRQADRQAERGEIEWNDCSGLPGIAKVFECGTLVAPLDYTNLEDPRNAAISLVRYKAGGGETPREEVLGSLLFNPGGPGGSGIDFLAHAEGTPKEYTVSYQFDRIVGSKYDLVSFDPRGVGMTQPQVDCFNDTHELLYYELTTSADGLPGSHARRPMKHEFGSLLADLQIYGSICAGANDAQLLQYLGTPFVARDMHLLHNALGESHINYWGFSYGSVLGSTYADMFPESVRRLVIDGVVDVPTYYDGTMINTLKDTEAEYDHFFKECFKSGPEKCRLAGLAASYKELKKLVLDYGNRLKTHPIPILHVHPPRTVTYVDFMARSLASMYAPAAWPRLADIYYEAIAEGKPEVLLLPLDLHPIKGATAALTATEAIMCGDSLTIPPQDGYSSIWSISRFEEHYEKMMTDSSNFAGVFSSFAPLCSGAWQARSLERHSGDFTSKPAFPLLAIGNEFDPVTPGRYADKIAAMFPGSVSVRRDGYGHCSISQASQCVEDVAYKYFVDGELPEPGTRCPVDVPVFGSGSDSKHAVISEALLKAHVQVSNLW